jgi:hypothetical protein
VSVAKTQLVPFDVSPFPYRGIVPEKDKPFLDAQDGERRGHTSGRGGIYWENTTYSDRRVLLHIPRGFDPRRPAVMVVYFHGNLARLERDVRIRQQVPRQVAESGLNAVLVAPQFAVDALDSSAGRLWEPGVFARFVKEAGERLAQLHGDARTRELFGGMPAVLAAYSGGYHPAAWAVEVGGANERVLGMILLDALYAEEEKFARWIALRQPSIFFFSAYGKSARDSNVTLQRLLTEHRVTFQTKLPLSLAKGSVAFLATTPEIAHADFVTEAWVRDPLKVLMARIPGFSRAMPGKPAKIR